MSDANSALWHYGVNNQQYGPVPESQIQQLLAQGVLNRTSFVWRDGMANWAALGDTPLAAYLTAAAGSVPPPPPPYQAQPQPQQAPYQPQPNPYQTNGSYGQAGGQYGYAQVDANAPPLVNGPVEALTICMQKYVGFTGRAARPEYWYFVLFTVLGSIITGLVDGVIGTELIGLLFSLAILLPSLAVGVRRLHDTDRTGWWLLIGLIPLIGTIVLIVMFCQAGTPGPNRYGPANPNRS